MWRGEGAEEIVKRDRERETEGGRMEEDNGFSPNKCTA